MYKLLKNGNNVLINIVKEIENGGIMVIPIEPANSHYQEFLKDLANDVELLDADGNPADQGTIKAILRGQV